MNYSINILFFFTFLSFTFAQNYSNEIEFLNTNEAFEQLAKQDIQKGTTQLFYALGFNSTNDNKDISFEKKYNISYYNFGCIAPKSDFLIAYNKIIFNYLSSEFGKSWLKEIRKDIPGLSEYKKSLKSYKISCSATFLPTIKNVSGKEKIPKSQSGFIAQLLSNDSLIINLNENDLNLFKKIAEQTNYQNKKMFNISKEVLDKIYKTKEIRLNLTEISNTKLNLTDLLSVPIDGAPFLLDLKSENNSVQAFSYNLLSIPPVNELGDYFLFYSIFEKHSFCNKINFTEYFSKENLYTLIINYLSYNNI